MCLPRIPAQFHKCAAKSSYSCVLALVCSVHAWNVIMSVSNMICRYLYIINIQTTNIKWPKLESNERFSVGDADNAWCSPLRWRRRQRWQSSVCECLSHSSECVVREFWYERQCGKRDQTKRKYMRSDWRQKRLSQMRSGYRSQVIGCKPSDTLF